MPSLTRKYMPGKDTHFYFFFLNKRKFRNVLELEQGTHHQKEKKKKMIWKRLIYSYVS